MHVYQIKVRVEGVGVVEETVSSYSPVDAQRAVQSRYAPAQVIVLAIRQIS